MAGHIVRGRAGCHRNSAFSPRALLSRRRPGSFAATRPAPVHPRRAPSTSPQTPQGEYHAQARLHRTRVLPAHASRRLRREAATPSADRRSDSRSPRRDSGPGDRAGRLRLPAGAAPDRGLRQHRPDAHGDAHARRHDPMCCRKCRRRAAPGTPPTPDAPLARRWSGGPRARTARCSKAPSAAPGRTSHRLPSAAPRPARSGSGRPPSRRSS